MVLSNNDLVFYVVHVNSKVKTRGGKLLSALTQVLSLNILKLYFITFTSVEK